MKTALAAWHYPQRTPEENVAFFADAGFEVVSLNGGQLEPVFADPERAAKLAAVVKEKGIMLTIHNMLPATHDEADVEAFHQRIDRFGAWQKQYGELAILSFDVPQPIRDRISSYVDYVLQAVPNSKIAVEDFGLTEAECAQIEYLKAEPRFGFLLDLGHMFLRFCGKNAKIPTLFAYSELEKVALGQTDRKAFLQAFATKEFPVFEMHLHNNDGANDVHWVLRNGALDMAEVAAALKTYGFDGVLTIESAPGYRFECRGQAADDGILADKAYWETLVANA